MNHLQIQHVQAHAQIDAMLTKPLPTPFVHISKVNSRFLCSSHHEFVGGGGY